jgi:poly(A) polymerase
MKPATRIDTATWMARPQTLAVMKALSAGGQEPRFVGGCVRDALLGLPVRDIDIATPEVPERVIHLIGEAGLKSVPTGIEHGTITALSDGISFEITTLRRDIESFGRRARVHFTKDWAEDAARRDLTLNALYCDAVGNVFDPVGGLSDLRAGRIRFVGDAQTRIEEDILRLVRYFRFLAFYGVEPADKITLSVCSKMAPLIKNLSVERLWKELSTLLLAPDPTCSLSLMEAHSILPHLLPEAVRVDLLALLVRAEIAAGKSPNYLRRLATIVDLDRNGADKLARRFKFSAKDRRRISDLCSPLALPDAQANSKKNRITLYQLGQELFTELALIKATQVSEKDRLILAKLTTEIDLPQFSLVGQDIVDLGVPEGHKIGELLRQVESWWVAGDFTADRNKCLEFLRSLVVTRS